MAKATKNTPTEKDEFAQGRSNEASKAAYELCKVIAQTCLLINGGAATAVLALLGKDKVEQSILTFVPWGLAGYALGVAVSAVMLFCVMMMADNWNFYWYHFSYEKDKEAADESEAAANCWHNRMNWSFVLAIILFAMSSGLVALGMALSQPTLQNLQHLLPR